VKTIGLEVCEICGTQSGDKAGWFSIAGNGRDLEILPWNDTVQERADCRHTCCGDHLQQLLFSSAEEFLTPFTWFTSQNRGAWNAAALVPEQKDASAEETIMDVINEIDSVLLGASAEEDQTGFDA